MKKQFDFEEKVTYCHRIIVNTADEEKFDSVADEVADAIDCDGLSGKEIAYCKFCEKFGKENVEFSEDGSPNVECEAN